MQKDDEKIVIEKSLNNNSKKYNNGMYFTDGCRKIDFVLIYQRNNDNKTNHAKRLAFLKSLIKEDLEIEIQDDGGKVYLLKNFSYIDADGSSSPTHISNLVFIKIFATWETLCRYAEILKIRKQISSHDIKYDLIKKNLDQKTFFEKFDFFNVFNIKELQPVPRGFTTPYSKSKEYLFDFPKDKSTFFTPAERSLIVNYILRRASYQHISDKCMTESIDIDVLDDIISKRNDIEMSTITNVHSDTEANIDSSCHISNYEAPRGDVSPTLEYRESFNKSLDFGIVKLISEGVFESAYILHESPLTEEDGHENVRINERNLLNKHWVSMRNVFRLQPLDHIKQYFGEKVAFYFAWLGYYTYWLLPISILGIMITLYNIIYTSNDIFVKEIYRGQNITMCPLVCSSRDCKFWKLSDGYYRFFMTRMLDNGAVVIMAIVMSIWASLFLEMWKRQQIQLAYHWNVHDMEYENEPVRPEFVSLIDKNYPKKISQISGEEEPFIPFWRKRVPVMFFTYSTVLLSIVMALAFLVGIILYKLVTFSLLRMRRNHMVSNMSNIITAATGSMLSLIIIITLTLVYSRVAVWLTDLEHHRTQSQYDNSVTLKLYLLEFINNYSSIFYIGFIQPYTLPMPSFKSSSIIKPRGCPAGGCLLDLSMQLAFIMIGKQIISHIKEYTLPRLGSSLRQYKLKKFEKSVNQNGVNSTADDVDLNNESTIKVNTLILDSKSIDKIEPELIRCYADYILADPGPRPLFDEYLEMLIQFGFITIFIPAFPLAPLLALINNLLEVRSDALKFVRALKRPVAQRVKDIGIWINILSIVAKIAVKSNAILIAFATTYVERLIYIIGYSKTGYLHGFTEFSMSYMNSSKFNSSYSHNSTLDIDETYCRYMGFQYPPWETNYSPYSYTAVYWQILTAKVVFVYFFENLVYLFMTIISIVIPDVPDKLRSAMKQESTLTNKIILEAELLRHKNQYASKKVAESFKKSVLISKQQRNKHKSEHTNAGV